MSRLRGATAVALLMFGVTAACAQTVALSEMISYDTLRNATGGDDLLHEFSQEPETVRVTVQCKLKRGQFAWRVETPEGEVLWRNEVSAKADLRLQEQFAGQVGRWRIVIDYKNAKGRYHIKLEQVTER